MKAPLHQSVIGIAKYILAGILAVGAVLDSFANAISLLTPLIAGIGTAFILLGWLLISIILRFHPLSWVEANHEVPLRKLGIKPTAFIVGMVLLLWIPSLLTPFQNKNFLPTASQPNITATEHSIAAAGDITATAQPGGTAIIAAGNVTFDAKEIVESLLKTHERELTGFREREQAYQDQVKALTGAVTALSQREGPTIAEAVAQLQQGHTKAAEIIFQDILINKTAEGAVANQQAAEAARHPGALAFLHDTEKALNAYRQAVRLDPENADGWTQLGHLLMNTGQLGPAADAYRKVVMLGENPNNRSLIANIYSTLGFIYLTLGDPVQAETMRLKGLELHKVLGNKDGMLVDYLNLSIVYRMQGNDDQAETMQCKGLTLSQEVSEAPQVEHVQFLLRALYPQGCA